MSTSSWRAMLTVALIWAAIYLPGLGTLEIKGEEGRRILPAVSMLQTGNYLVPQIGSQPYFNKPPLVNWLVAASFQIFGKRNEWTARLPSALWVLLVAIAFVTIARRSLGASGSLIASLVWMTNFGVIEKGRLIEIEALYISLSGLAMICWLSWWQERRSSWLTWTVPWIFLGLGLLAKGPLHLLFFYSVVFAVLHRKGELRTCWNFAHLLGILLMLAIFAAWAIPYLQAMHESDVTHSWSRQFSGRLSGEGFKFSGWLLNIPRGLAYFLPWTLILAFGKHETSNIEDRTSNGESPASSFDLRCSIFDICSALSWSIGLSFLAVSLLPGSLARYTMPLLVPAAWLAALCLTNGCFKLPRWLRFKRPSSVPTEMRLPMIVALLVSAAIALYMAAVIPFQQRHEKIRTIANQINAALPANEPLYAIDPDYQPFLFYVRAPLVYLRHVAETPATARYLLVQPADEAEALRSAQWNPRRPRPILHLKDYRKKEVTIFEIGEPG